MVATHRPVLQAWKPLIYLYLLHTVHQVVKFRIVIIKLQLNKLLLGSDSLAAYQ